MAWDKRKFQRDVQTGWDRINRWTAVVGTPQVAQAYAAFTQVMRQEGEWIDAGYHRTNSAWQADWRNRPESVDARNALVAAFREVDALRVSAEWATRHGNVAGTDLTQARRDVAAASAQNTAFWVKSTSRPAEQVGNSLEQGSAAGIFDQLTYGFASQGGTPSPSLWELWGQLSPEFAAGTRGTAQATVFEGLPESCVLRSAEWPELLRLIQAGEVDHLHVNVIRRNSDSGRLEQIGHYNVRTQEEFDHLPRVTRTDSYATRQQREFVTQNVARAIERNREGVQTTLDTFRRRWSQSEENVEFVLSHPDGPGPDLSETPQNLSRMQTNTSGQGPAAGRRGSAASLMSKLEILEAQQGQGSDSGSIFPARRGSLASAASMSGMSRVASFAADSPAVGYGGMPATTAPSPYLVSPYTVSESRYPPVSASGYFSGYTIPSTLPPISEPRPAAPVFNPMSFNPLPTGDTRGSTPSTDSAESDVGAPLARVSAHAGGSAGQQAPVGPPDYMTPGSGEQPVGSSSEKSKRKEKKPGSKTLAALKFIAGTGPRKKPGGGSGSQTRR